MTAGMMELAKDVAVFTASAFVSVWLSSHSTASKGRTVIATRALVDGSSLNNQEHVCTVSMDNIPTANGHSRKDMRLSNLWHRATYCIVRCTPSENDEIQVLVQKRSKIKDYCPGRLDGTPGGVVGWNESYRENAMRELEEEMGIDASETMKRLFTFPYQDDVVKVWGELFEVTYDGNMEELVLQESEVDEVLRMSLSDIKTSMSDNPHAWMPDALHAMQLYLQYLRDLKTQRRFLRGYSSHMDAYKVRPKPQVVFFDCDDCLYFDNWKVAKLLTAKIDSWCVANGLKPGQAYQLYKTYGTALKGLVAEGYIDGSSENAIDAFLSNVHDVGVPELLEQDLHLRQLLLQMDPSIPKYVFTASVRHHAERCLEALGIDDLFVDIIDVKACNLETKHNIKSFETAMRIAGITDPEACIFFDDSVTNIRAARKVGWRSILVGRVHRDTGKPITVEDAEQEIDVIHDFPTVLPELFMEQATEVKEQPTVISIMEGQEPLN